MKILDYSSNHLTYMGMISLKQIKTLQTLDLSHNAAITNHELMTLLHNDFDRPLKSINLIGTAVKAGEGISFAELMHYLPERINLPREQLTISYSKASKAYQKYPSDMSLALIIDCYLREHQLNDKETLTTWLREAKDPDGRQALLFFFLTLALSSLSSGVKGPVSLAVLNPNTKKIEIKEPDLSKAELMALLYSIFFTDLREIALREQDLSDDICAILARLPKLEVLHLIDCNMTDNGMMELEVSQTIQSLNIRRPKIAVSGAEGLRFFNQSEDKASDEADNGKTLGFS